MPLSPLPLCLWSGPRNVSTALMYAFAQRPDTQVVDEPLYAHYLRVSGAIHPGREEVMAAQEQEGDLVMQELLQRKGRFSVLLMKHMAHHLVEMKEEFLLNTANVLLIRHPAEVIHSFSKVIPDPTLADIGIQRQAELYLSLLGKGHPPLVLDGSELLKAPAEVLAKLCEQVAIPFHEEMLRWPTGARPEDGVWAPHWYHQIHHSTGFRPYQPKDHLVPERYQALLDAAMPPYDLLFQHAIRA